MGAGIYIELNIISGLIGILLFCQQKRHKVFDFLGSTAFNSILWMTVLIMVTDTVSWLIIADLIKNCHVLLKVLQSLYYLLQAVVPMLFFRYCLEVSGYPARGVWSILMCVPVALTALLLIANFDGGMVFYIYDGHIRRGSGFLLSVIAPAIYIINSLLLCTVFYFRAQKHDQMRQTIARCMLVGIGLSVVAAVISTFVASCNPWHAFVTALVYLYIRLHSYQEYDLNKKATTDSLTGLKNHAAYSMIKEKMDQRIREESNLRFAVAVMDVNGLKHTNDVYGHEAGNTMIIAAGRLMCEVFRHSPVCRIGGDEFVAILENSDYENREELRVRFAERMQEYTYPVAGGERILSVALGIAEYDPEQHKVFEDVFQAADETMYQNKAVMKNL